MFDFYKKKKTFQTRLFENLGRKCDNNIWWIQGLRESRWEVDETESVRRGGI
jgi:hypothetical protein